MSPPAATPNDVPGHEAAAILSDEERERLHAFEYLGWPDAPTYIAIMRLFASALLAEWSAQDVVDGLAPEASTPKSTASKRS